MIHTRARAHAHARLSFPNLSPKNDFNPTFPVHVYPHVPSHPHTLTPFPYPRAQFLSP